MSRSLAPLACLLLLAACGRVVPPRARPSVSPETDDPEWHYAGDEGPDHWAELSPRFTACRDGRRQSPIDIVSSTHVAPPSLQLQFQVHPVDSPAALISSPESL